MVVFIGSIRDENMYNSGVVTLGAPFALSYINGADFIYLNEDNEDPLLNFEV